MTRMKQTTNTKDTAILVKAPIMVGNTLVESTSSLSPQIQFHIIGKHVFNAIHLHSSLDTHSAAYTFHHTNPKLRTHNIHINKYAKTFLFIYFGIKK